MSFVRSLLSVTKPPQRHNANVKKNIYFNDGNGIEKYEKSRPQRTQRRRANYISLRRGKRDPGYPDKKREKNIHYEDL
jgi:hypothetical protein